MLFLSPFVCFACLFYKRKLYLIETKRRQREELKQVKVVSRWVFFFQSLCVFLWIFYRKAHQDAKYACIIYKLKLENFPPDPGQDIEKDGWVLSERETRIWDIGPTIILFWVKGETVNILSINPFSGSFTSFSIVLGLLPSMPGWYRKNYQLMDDPWLRWEKKNLCILRTTDAAQAGQR